MKADDAELPLPMSVALAWTSQSARRVIRPFFLIDARLGRIVMAVREPILAQMRLAWWRDRLSEQRELRPKGDPVLDAIGLHWQGEERALAALVDGWEELLGEAPLGEPVFARFAAGRGAAFGAVARLCAATRYAGPAHALGCRFALGDCLARLSDPIERERMLSVAAQTERDRTALPRALRPLAILGGLGERVLRRGEGPLFGDRGSALLATRLGIWGR